MAEPQHDTRAVPVPADVDFIRVQWHVNTETFDALLAAHGPADVESFPDAEPPFQSFPFETNGVGVVVFSREREGGASVVAVVHGQAA